MLYDYKMNYIYIFVINSVYVLNVMDKKVVYFLQDIHNRNVTACVWSSLNQMFVTGCR